MKINTRIKEDSSNNITYNYQVYMYIFISEQVCLFFRIGKSKIVGCVQLCLQWNCLNNTINLNTSIILAIHPAMLIESTSNKSSDHHPPQSMFVIDNLGLYKGSGFGHTIIYHLQSSVAWWTENRHSDSCVVNQSSLRHATRLNCPDNGDICRIIAAKLSYGKRSKTVLNW